MSSEARGFLKSMWRSRPLRLAVSLLLLTTSVLFTAEFFHFRGDRFHGMQEARKTIAETLAVQLSALAGIADSAGIKYSVASFVARNESVVAASLVSAEGIVLSEYGDLEQLRNVSKGSTYTHLNVPIFHGSEPWGDVKVVFYSAGNSSQELLYFAFVLGSCLLAYVVFLRKALIDLDPTRVVPTRVTAAFNMFSEGVIILDRHLRILLVNDSVASTLDKEPDELVGKHLDEWPWLRSADWQAPWATTLDSGINITDQPLRLELPNTEPYFYMVSTSLIGNENEGMRGVLVTLDNMTVIEQKNNELAMTLRKLRQSQESITRKNRELEALATRDPLTGLANRRALMEACERDFTKARRENEAFCCVMTDIDHFKLINDNHGHAVGDEIICAVGNTLRAECRDYDTLGRYGGEEFVVLLPGRSLDEAVQIAERMRATIAHLAERATVPVNKLSASFGVAAIEADVNNVSDLLERADQALYSAKHNGRNRVVPYSHDLTVFESAEPVAQSTQGEGADTAERVAALEAMVDQRTRDLIGLRECDSLTGAPKRVVFLHRIDTEIVRAERSGTQIGVLSLEIKELNRVLSCHGNEIGDALILQFCNRLQDGLRRSDVVSEIFAEQNLSRITTNEFGVLLSDLDLAGQAVPVITRLKRLLTAPFSIGEHVFTIGANIGIALYPESGKTSTELLEEATLARIDASKKTEKVSHSFATTSLEKVSADYIRMENDLYNAIENGEFEVYFQPKFELARQCISSLETLLRWHHPENGLIPPDRFIPIAEANGMIHDLSRFVLNQALRQLHIWRSLGNDSLRVSINISPNQLRDPNLVNDILQTLEDNDISGEQLEVELTETSVFDSPERARIVCNALREAGIRVAMDDFGTGYTSLSLLAELPLDAVKIDRRFIHAMDSSEQSRAVVESVIGMAQALKLWVIAEGVETNEQLSILSILGCNELQGYLFSHPLPANEVTRFLQQQNTLPPALKRA